MTDLPSTDDYPEAATVRDALESFVAELDDRLSQPELRKLLTNNGRLDEYEIGYKPETYTESKLVIELLDAVSLDYNREPKATGVNRKRWPDFELTNTDIPIIGEIKPVNGIADGESEIKEYLGIDTFDTPYGILTDGFEWRIYSTAAPEAGGSALVKQVQIRDAVRAIAQQEQYVALMTQPAPTEDITLPLTQFVTMFRQADLNEWSLVELPAEKRGEYVSEGFQTSLDDLL